MVVTAHAKLAGCWAPGVLLGFPPISTHIRVLGLQLCAWPHIAFYKGAGNLAQVLVLKQQCPFPTELSPQAKYQVAGCM